MSHLLQRTVAALLSDADIRSGLDAAAAHYAGRNEVFLAKLAEAGLASPSVDGLNIWVDLGVPSTAATADLRGRGWIVRDGGLFRLGDAGGGAAGADADTHLRLTVHELSDADMDRLVADLVAVAGAAEAAASTPR